MAKKHEKPTTPAPALGPESTTPPTTPAPDGNVGHHGAAPAVPEGVESEPEASHTVDSKPSGDFEPIETFPDDSPAPALWEDKNPTAEETADRVRRGTAAFVAEANADVLADTVRVVGADGLLELSFRAIRCLGAVCSLSAEARAAEMTRINDLAQPILDARAMVALNETFPVVGRS